MDYTGLISKFKVNRLLTDEERALQLKQGQRLDVDMVYQRAVIRMNSTYLETTDKFYAWVGYLAFGMLTLAIMLGVASVWISSILLEKVAVIDMDLTRFFSEFGPAHGFLIVFFMLILFLVSIWGFKLEAFRYTHYPIRLNRKTRMVHAFRYDGTVISAPWDKLFFTLGRGNRHNLEQNWDIRGHVLDKDGVNVVDTFSLGAHAGSQEGLRRFWEMHRRYMEEGPQAIVELVRYYMPLEDGRRESFRFGWMRWWSNMQESHVAFWFFAIVMPLIATGRWIAMRTSKVPLWPAEIEAQCRIEANDPFERDSRNNPQGLWSMLK